MNPGRNGNIILENNSSNKENKRYDQEIDDSLERINEEVDGKHFEYLFGKAKAIIPYIGLMPNSTLDHYLEILKKVILNEDHNDNIILIIGYLISKLGFDELSFYRYISYNYYKYSLIYEHWNFHVICRIKELVSSNEDDSRHSIFPPIKKFESSLSPGELDIYQDELRLIEPPQDFSARTNKPVSSSVTDTPFLNSMISVRPRDSFNYRKRKNPQK